MSAGKQNDRYGKDAAEAVERAQELLMKVRQQFLLVQLDKPLAGKVGTTFQSYFGPSGTLVAPATLAFDTASPTVQPPVFAVAQVSNRKVVHEVLRRVCDIFLSNQNFQVNFGGKGIDDGTRAYVSGATSPTKIHLAQEFFALKKIGEGTQAGTIVHELTHTWARTDDHDYGAQACRTLATSNLGQALSNADNYRFFVEKAFT